MILEQLPNVRSLTPSQKRQLAEELLVEVDGDGEEAVDPAIVSLLEQRLAEYDANPSAVTPWETVRARVFGRHAS